MNTISISDYPFESKPRWGYGNSRNLKIVEALERNRRTYSELLGEFDSLRKYLHSIKQEPDVGNETMPFWGQGWFSALDAAALVCFIALNRPKNYIEIGSGNSTKFARHAVDSFFLETTLVSIDPQPRAAIDALCSEVIRLPLQSCDLSVFDRLGPGDILFFDGSHRIFTNSDVMVFFFEVLPRLKSGVLVHVHDVFLPDDYPPEWTGCFYSEQYILAAMMIGERPPIDVIMPNYYVTRDEELSKQVAEIFAPLDGSSGINLFYDNTSRTPGLSFWFKTAF